MTQYRKDFLLEAPNDASEMTKLARKFCKKWIGILALNEWEIRIKFVMPQQLMQGAIAQILPNYHSQVAELQICAFASPEYLEKIILHELLHLRIGRILYQMQMVGLPDRITNQEMAEISEQAERAVIQIARAIMRVNNKKPKPKQKRKKKLPYIDPP